ncbi:MAG: isoprenylcysteine carboxylmethyltransferase family protein [Methanotrichaceae archaeon]|nr:isoprenylcysteine carboxylmethyltransferase family protein [Methanotrichaceae archaeon]
MSLWLLRHDPGLLQERMTGLKRSDQKASDKVLMSLITICFIAWLVLMSLDAVRFHWSHMPVWIQVVGAIVLIGSFYLFYLVYRENPYLSPTIRIQEERGQTVVSTGPYHYVRHPYYSASFLFIMGTTLLLGSWYGVLAGVILASMISTRALLEKRMLWKELKGYDIYMAQMKYRFIPYVW